MYYDGDESDKETFLIATREEGARNSELETYSPSSPLGKALIEPRSARHASTRCRTVRR